MQGQRLEVPGLQRHLQFPFDIESARDTRQAVLVEENDAVGFCRCRALQENSDARAASSRLRNAFLSTPLSNWKQTRSCKMLTMLTRRGCSLRLTIGPDHDETARVALQ